MKQPLERTEVLDHGYVELWDVMGSDDSICDAARVSYADATKRSSNRNLIRYLWSSKHTSPFEQVVFQFRVKMPIFIARQWVRHRTARLNEISGRYSELPEEYYFYSEQGLPLQATDNKQGSLAEEIDPELAEEFYTHLRSHNEGAFRIYHSMLGNGVSKEIARCHLPLSTYTSWVWQMDLHNLLHFLHLRMDPHAQAEIRAYADAIYEMIKGYVPLTVEAFEDYTLNAMVLSAMDVLLLSELIATHELLTIEDAIERCSLSGKMSKRDIDAFKKKYKRIREEWNR